SPQIKGPRAALSSPRPTSPRRWTRALQRHRQATGFQRLPDNGAMKGIPIFRYNRRFHRHVSFEALLGLAAQHEPASYWEIVKRDNPRKGVQTARRAPRRRKTATGMRQDGASPAPGVS